MLRIWIGMTAFLVGCGSPIVGEWEGVCTTRMENELYDYTVDLEIEDIKKGDLNGTGTIVNEENSSYSGPLDGTRDGNKISMTVLLEDIDAKFTIDAQINGREINGDCVVYGTQFGDVALELDE